MRGALTTFTHRSMRKGFNTLVQRRMEMRTALDRLSYAARGFAYRSQLRSFRKLVAGAQMFAIAKRASRSLLHRSQRRGMSGWLSMMEERALAFAQLRAASGAFQHRGLRAALNTMIVQRAERLSALARLRAAATSFVQRELLKGWHTLRSLGRLRRIARDAGANLLLRNLRMSLNSWLFMVGERHLALRQMRGALTTFTHRGMRKGFSTLLARQQRRGWLEQRLRAAALAIRYRHSRRGLDGWLFGHAWRRSARANWDEAAQRWLQTAVCAAWHKLASQHAQAAATERLASLAARRWAATQRARTSVALTTWAHRVMRAWTARLERPISQLHAWVRERMPTPAAVPHRVAADEVHALERMLLVPHAALVAGADGVLWRVTAVKPPATESAPSVHTASCTVDLARGYDKLMLMAHPLPAAGEAGAKVRAAVRAPSVRLAADALTRPAFPLIVPGFFGGVLRLDSGLHVRLLDCSFDERPPISALHSGGGDGASADGGDTGTDGGGDTSPQHAMTLREELRRYSRLRRSGRTEACLAKVHLALMRHQAAHPHPHPHPRPRPRLRPRPRSCPHPHPHLHPHPYPHPTLARCDSRSWTPRGSAAASRSGVQSTSC